jgi:hypothetical protein
MKGRKFFLLLEDDTVGSVKCNHFNPPSTYQGRKVIFAAPQLTDIDLLRMILRSTVVGEELLDTRSLSAQKFLQPQS